MKPFLFSLLFCLTLAACSPALQTPSTPTPVAQSAVFVGSTGTPPSLATSTAAPTRTPPPTATLRASPTTIPTSTATASFTPSSYSNEPTATKQITPPSPYSVVPVMENVAYQLQKPSSEKLVELAILVMEKEYEIESQGLVGFDEATDSLWRESREVLEVINYDLTRYYPTGFPGATLDKPYDAKNFTWGLGLPDWLEAYLRSWAIEAIVSQNVRFAEGKTRAFDGIEFTTHRVDFGEVGENYWLVEVRFTPFDYITWLLFSQSSTGVIKILPNEIPSTFRYADWLFYTDIKLDFTHDLTGDQAVEIIVSGSSNSFGYVAGEVFVYGWIDGELKYLSSFELPSINSRYRDAAESTFTFIDIDQDGIDEIQVIWPQYADFGCNWLTFINYDWDSHEFVASYQDLEIPTDTDLPECYISRGIWGEKGEDHARWLEKALETLPADTSPDVIAWLHLRLMAAYLGQNRMDEANTVLEKMVDLPEDTPFQSFIHESMRVGGYSPMEVCSKAFNRAKKIDSDLFINSDIDNYLAPFGGQTFSEGPDPNKVCPMLDMPYDQLLSQSIPSAVDPVTGYRDAGLELKFAQAFNIDADADWEWIALYNHRLTILDAVSGRWQPDFVYYYIDDILSIQSTTADINYDLNPDLLVMIERSKPFGYEAPPVCAAGEKSFTFIAIDGTTHDLVTAGLGDEHIPCIKDAPDLSTVDGIRLFRGYLSYFPKTDRDWYLLMGYPQNDPSYWDVDELVTAIENRIRAGESISEARQDCFRLLDYLPEDNIRAENFARRLRFLIGYSYEVEGKSDDAVKAYLELIQAAPNSAWSWLAWTHLSPQR